MTTRFSIKQAALATAFVAMFTAVCVQSRRLSDLRTEHAVVQLERKLYKQWYQEELRWNTKNIVTGRYGYERATPTPEPMQ